MNQSPVVEEITAFTEPEEIFLRLAHLPHCLFLDSAMRHATLGRYSFVAADPFDYWEVPADGRDGLAEFSRRMACFRAPTVPGLPPFQGGAAGLLSYDLGRSIETLPEPRADEFQVPVMAVGLYDVVVAMDHLQRRAWIVSQGFPDTDPAQRAQRAYARLRQMRSWLAVSPDAPPGRAAAGHLPPINETQLAARCAMQERIRLLSSFSRESYLQAAERAIGYVLAGDVFQVNLSQRLLYPAADHSVSLYARLRQRNPAPFAGYFDLGDFQIVSASPERFLQVRGREVETRPIKGTRRRSGIAETDRHIESELLHSEKDRAENVMIVDLLRNDLSRVCQADTVCVHQLCRPEGYRHVLHLVSAVRGRLRDECAPLDLVRAAFPGGSITGAPKVRAMQIIAELEPAARGAYCGSLGYLGFDGTMDLSILIRTITAGRGWWQAPVGGGIVAQSVPELEYEETWHKAEGLLRALAP